MSDDFMKHIDAITGNAPAAPKAPPLPPKKAPPAPPKPDGYAVQPSDAADRLRAIAAQLPAFTPDDAKPTAEAGFVNPPDSGAVLCATPEEAAAAQGIVAPQPDELDGMTHTQLKARCVELGIDHGKLREAGLRKKIREHVPSPNVEAISAEIDAAQTQIRTIFAEAMVAPVNEETSRAASETLEDWNPAKEFRQTETAFILERARNTQAFKAAEAKVVAAQETPQMKIQETKFTLYVNSYPLRVETLSQSTLVAEANKMIKDTIGVDDYRLCDYGKGPAVLTNWARELLAAKAFGEVKAITIDTRTPEGSVLLTTLEGLAGLVVRGV